MDGVWWRREKKEEIEKGRAIERETQGELRWRQKCNK